MNSRGDFAGAVAAAVIHQHHFPGLAGALQGCGDAALELREVGLLVVDGDDERDHEGSWVPRAIPITGSLTGQVPLRLSLRLLLLPFAVSLVQLPALFIGQ